jgi:hypothetical protein
MVPAKINYLAWITLSERPLEVPGYRRAEMEAEAKEVYYEYYRAER